MARHALAHADVRRLDVPLAHRLFNAPLALAPAQARLVEHLLLQGGDATALLGLSDSPAKRPPYDLVQGVAVINVQGLLLDDDDCWWWGGTSYAQIRRALTAAMADPAASAVALLVNSPGGMVSGCFDLADEIFALRGRKPIWAILAENAFSAAYALACAADRVLIPRTGGAGSIGIVTMHTDVSAMLDRAGIRVTTVQYGARKTDTYPTTPLTDPALQRLQADIDTLGELFVETVARNRALGADAVRATEGGTFLGAAAVQAGLADEVLSPEAALQKLIASIETPLNPGVPSWPETAQSRSGPRNPALPTLPAQGRPSVRQAPPVRPRPKPRTATRT